MLVLSSHLISKEPRVSSADADETNKIEKREVEYDEYKEKDKGSRGIDCSDRAVPQMFCVKPSCPSFTGAFFGELGWGVSFRQGM